MEKSELLAKINSNNAPVVVDVRSVREYKSGHIPGAKHIPFWGMLYRYKELQDKKAKLVVLYCEHGPRAWLAKPILNLHGFKDVIFLQDHMKGWKKDGYIIER